MKPSALRIHRTLPSFSVILPILCQLSRSTTNHQKCHQKQHPLFIETFQSMQLNCHKRTISSMQAASLLLEDKQMTAATG